MNKQTGERAVVLGASMAGLLAARVLADAYAQVTVIDRDELPETTTHRRGVPQGRHIHALAARGQQALEELFPGLTAELVADGVPAGDLLADARLYLSGHRLRQAHTGLVLLCASRPLLEAHVRARVRALPNVTSPGPLRRRRAGHHPRRSPSHRGAGASSGRRQRRGGAGRRPGVDASGRGSRTPAWLDALGYARPAGRRCGSGWGTRPGPTGCRPTPSTATWRFWSPRRPSIHGPGHAATRRRSVDGDAGRHPR